ncbi:MAG: DUF434 domain-containing protein [Thermogutta sp.]
MPDRRQHRGPHPEDQRLFDAAMYPRLFAAFRDLCWLLDHGYAMTSSLKLVGDRYELAARQRLALERCACTAGAVVSRRGRMCSPQDLAGGSVHLDGYNVLTTIEAALGGGVLLGGRDGTLRDMASMHGSYRKVAETPRAIVLIGKTLAAFGVSAVLWYLDKPVSNSGRLGQLLRNLAAEHEWNWVVKIVASPDHELQQSNEPVGTADHVILDNCRRWINLARWVVESHITNAWVLDFAKMEDRH